jgi:hypothetical protein
VEYTKPELDAEWDYRYREMLGMMCGAKEPTTEQIDLAAKEADRVVARLKEANGK